MVNGSLSLCDYLGNQIADAMAGAAAHLSADSSLVRSLLARNSALAFAAALRLACIEAEAIKAHGLRASWELLHPGIALSVDQAMAQLHERLDNMATIWLSLDAPPNVA